MKRLIDSILSAIYQARVQIISIFLIYCLSCLAGILMAHLGDRNTLEIRDKLVNKALVSDRASIDYQKGRELQAALRDFGGNLFLGALPQAVMGLSVVVPFFSVPVQGWIAGIVSVDNQHFSRFRNIKATCYYFIVILLQFIPYSLTIGSGVKLGLDCYKYNKTLNSGFFNYKLKRESLADLGYAFIAAIPVFLLASVFEFMSAWNL